MGAAFVIDRRDNVATALAPLEPGAVALRGDAAGEVPVAEPIPAGHTLARLDIPEGADIVKYGVRIGIASRPSPRGGWVHLHCMKSAYVERSNHLDARTGAPRDTLYE